jgi:hypothetical protein
VLIYVGSAADFALNSENHWLFHTMRLPERPQDRFLETFAYNQRIFFSPAAEVPNIAEEIRAVHTKVEESRSAKEGHEVRIPNRAFREVGDMLVDYGIRAHEYLNRRAMRSPDREQYYQDLRSFLELMGVEELDPTHAAWRRRRERSIREDLNSNVCTEKLFEAYRKDLGRSGFWILRQFQAHFVPPAIASKLKLNKNPLFSLAYRLYPYFRILPISRVLWRVYLRPKTRRVLQNMERLARNTFMDEVRKPSPPA